MNESGNGSEYAHEIASVETLRTRLPRHVDIALGIVWSGGLIIVVRDSVSGEFCRLPGLPSGRNWAPLALTRQGDGLLYVSDDRQNEPSGLYLRDFETDRQIHIASGDDLASFASISPDRSTIATLNSDPAGGDIFASEFTVVVREVDVTSGDSRQIWATDGTWADESVVGWSPNGEHIAVGYVDADEMHAVAVLNRAGTILHHDDEAILTRAPNGMWVSDAEIVICSERNRTISARNIRTGQENVIGRFRKHPIAVNEEGILVASTQGGNGSLILARVDSETAEVRQVLATLPTNDVPFIDVLLN